MFIYSNFLEYSLLLGKGNGEFLNFTAISGIRFEKMSDGVISAKFVDLNNDGNLDLYFSANRYSDYLFAGDGAGRFINKFAESNISKAPNYNSYGTTFADFNNDMRTDIFLYYISLANGKSGSIYSSTTAAFN